MNVALCVICGKLVPEIDVAAHPCCKAQYECDHEWQCNDGGYTETCSECGATRDYDGSVDDGRDFSPPYEP